MRKSSRVMLAGFLGVAASTAAFGAERERSRGIPLGYGPQKPPVVQANPCLAHGPGFQAIPGTSSCVKVIGGVRAEAGSTRKLR